MAKSGGTATTAANLGFEDKLWAAADKLRGNMDAAEYKHVVLGLIFLKYISDAFMEKFNALQAEDLADPEDKDEYLAGNIFWVPPEARWSYLQKNAKRPEIGTLVDDASGEGRHLRHGESDPSHEGCAESVPRSGRPAPRTDRPQSTPEPPPGRPAHTLLPKLLSGEIELPDAESIAEEVV